VASDFLTVFLCHLLSYSIYTQGLDRVSPHTFNRYLILATVISFVYLLILDRVGLYKREISLLNIKEMRGIFYTGIYGAAFVLSASFYIRPLDFSRILTTLAIVLTPIGLYFQRQIFYRAHLLFHQRGWSQTRVVIYGAGAIGKQLAKRIFESPSLGLLPVGFLDDDSLKSGQRVRWNGAGPKHGLPILGGQDALDQLIGSSVDLLLIALPSAKFERNQKLVEHCNKIGLEYFIVPNSYEQFIQHVELMEIGGVPILRRRKMEASVYYLAAKRILDFLIATAMAIVLSPLFLNFGLLIRRDSAGPVIFKQKRVGQGGKEFSFYKFRTMHVAAPKYAPSPLTKEDPRVTSVGRWLRRTSLDELPQLYNVIRGDMSLVGPRPEMPFVVAGYTSLERKRLEAKPGITGVWQISAVRGEPIHANLEYDLFYIHNRSLLLDFAILAKTVISVIRGIGAN
jgi:exopolysaccharide biosynthesis polyprenyl glycosylphosphotransferase